MDLATLIASIATAIAAILAAHWGWFDHPQHGWNVYEDPVNYVPYMDLTTLIASIAAAIAAIIVARWEWFDRPQHGWNVRMEREYFSESTTAEGATVYRRPRATFSVQAVGTAVVHNVKVRTPGVLYVTRPGSDETPGRAEERRSLYQATMSAGSKPIEFDIFFRDTGKTYVEITWTRLRPYQRLGERVDARALAEGENPTWEHWRWDWLSLRPGFQAGGRWWMVWPVRTKGRWVAARQHVDRGIPETQSP